MINEKFRHQLPDLSNGEKMIRIKEAFEKRFGADQLTRTRAQWCDLVNTYGLETVMKKESMSRGAVRRKCGYGD